MLFSWLKYQGDELLAPHGGSETGKHADRVAIPAPCPCLCQGEIVIEVAGRTGWTSLFSFG